MVAQEVFVVVVVVNWPSLHHPLTGCDTVSMSVFHQHCVTYQTTQPVAPGTVRLGILVEIDNQKDKADEHRDQGTRANQPPCPPQWLPTPEEVHWVQLVVAGACPGASPTSLEEINQAGPSIHLLAVIGRGSARPAAHGNIRVARQANPLAQRVRRPKKTQAQSQPHDEASNVSKIIQSWQKPQHERHRNTQDHNDQLHPRRSAVLPCIEEVQDEKSEDTEQCTRAAARRLALPGIVAAQNKAPNSTGHINQEISPPANHPLHVNSHGQLHDQVEADVDESGVDEHGDNKPEPLIGRRFVVKRSVWVRVRYTAETARFGQCALSRRRGGIRAREEDCFVGVLNARYVLHAWCVPRSHVNLHVRGWTDHHVEGWFRLNRRACKLSCRTVR